MEGGCIGPTGRTYAQGGRRKGGTLVMWASPSRAMSAPDGILDVSDSRNSTADALLTWLSAAASAPSSSPPTPSPCGSRRSQPRALQKPPESRSVSLYALIFSLYLYAPIYI